MHIVPLLFASFVALVTLVGIITPLLIPADRETRRQIGVRLPEDHD